MDKFPCHGKIHCRDCFKEDNDVRLLGQWNQWKMINDPGAWGSSYPRFLVLGFSKGATQTGIYENGEFDKVAFGGRQTRDNLTKILQTIGLLNKNEDINQRIKSEETDFHFASLVRCSLARLNELKSKYETSGTLIVKSFSEVPEIIHHCSSKYLLDLPSSLQAVLVLGTNEAYIDHVQQTVRNLYLGNFQEINRIAYHAGNVIWLHLTHPSRGNGHLKAWLEADSTNPSGRKREMAIQTVRSYILHQNY